MSDVVAILALSWAGWVISGITLDAEYTQSCKDNGYMETRDGRYNCSKADEAAIISELGE